MDKILVLTGTPHPKALIKSADAQYGVVLFRWLDSSGDPVTSDNSVARFTPVLPDEDGNYAEPSDAVLIAAIEGA